MRLDVFASTVRVPRARWTLVPVARHHRVSARRLRRRRTGRASGDVPDLGCRSGPDVVRVLTMSGSLFDLRPEDGRRALPRLLELAATKAYASKWSRWPTQRRSRQPAGARGRNRPDCHAHPNALLEIANEPGHPSQSAEVHQPDVLEALAARLAPEISIALGSIERGDGFGAGGLVTWHSPRDLGAEVGPRARAGAGRGPADDVEEASDQRRADWRRRIASAGRRDDVPARFRAAGLLSASPEWGRLFTTKVACTPACRRGVSSSASTRGTRPGRACQPKSSASGSFELAGRPRAS